MTTNRALALSLALPLHLAGISAFAQAATHSFPILERITHRNIESTAEVHAVFKSPVLDTPIRLHVQRFLGADELGAPLTFVPREVLEERIAVFTISFPNRSSFQLSTVEFWISISTLASQEIVYESPRFSLSLSDLQQLRAELETKKSELIIANQGKGDLQERIRDLEIMNAVYAERLEVLPSNINFEDLHLTDTDVKVLLSTNRHGRLRVDLKLQNSRSIWVDYQTRTTGPAKSHLASFDISSGQSYRISAHVITGASNRAIEGASIDHEKVPKLEFTPDTGLPNPQILFDPRQNVSTTHSRAEITVNVSRPAVVHSFVGRRQEPTNQIKQIRGRTDPALSRNDVGKIENPDSDFKEKHTFNFSDLRENWEYAVRFRAITKDGKESYDSPWYSFQTASRPPDFAFEDAVEIEMAPATGLVVTWSATEAPTSASLSVVEVPNSVLRTYHARILDDGRARVTVPNSDVYSIDTDKQTKLRLSMQNSNGKVQELAFRVALRLPQEDTAIPLIDAADKNQETEIARVLQGIQKGKKFKWKDLLATGLRLVL